MDYTRKGNAFGKGVTFRWWADDRWSPLQQRTAPVGTGVLDGP